MIAGSTVGQAPGNSNRKHIHAGKQAVEMDLPREKEGLNVITAARGPIAGNVVLVFKEKGFTNIRAVAGCSMDNPFIKNVLGWELKVPFGKGLASTCRWISQEYQKRAFLKK